MPTAAVCTMLKWMGSIPIFSAIGKTTGISTTAAGRPSSTMPNIMVISAVAHQEQPGLCPCSGPSTSASSFGTPDTPIRYWNTEATASRNTTAAVRIALS